MFELFNDISLQNTQFNLDAFTFIYPENMFGFEIEEWSASVGRLVMALAGLTTAIDFDIGQAPLPLRNSANIRCVDALLDGEQEVQREWDNFAIQSIDDPRPNFVNIIIGNPPFKGGRNLRDALGADYTELLFTQYNGQLKRSADLATYWVRKAEDCLIQGRCDAFGLVTTSSITQPASVGVLGYGLENGLVISLAHRIRDWPNSGASQTISITCMERDDEGAQFVDSLNTIPGMNEEIVSGILNSGLDNFLSILEYDSIGMDYGIEQLSLIEGINEELAIRIMNSARNHCNLRISQPPRLATERNGGLEECDRIYKHLRNFDMQPMLDPLAANMGRCPQGYKGFYKENPGGLMITEAQAQNLLEQSNGDNGPDNSDVVLNFAPGSYMDNRQYEWIIDFKEMAYDNAIEYLGPFAHLEENGRQDNVLSKDEDSYGRLFPVWWQPWRPRLKLEMR